jgi:hypothetical protein
MKLALQASGVSHPVSSKSSTNLTRSSQHGKAVRELRKSNSSPRSSSSLPPQLETQLETILTEMSKASAIERARIAKLSLLCSEMGYTG